MVRLQLFVTAQSGVLASLRAINVIENVYFTRKLDRLRPADFLTHDILIQRFIYAVDRLRRVKLKLPHKVMR